MIPYTHHHITPEDEAAVLRVLRSDYLTQGPEVEQLEAELCAGAGCQYAVCTASGTTALEILYLALQFPLVACPAISFVATAAAAERAGSGVRFLDCDARTGLITDPAGIFVTLGGQPPTLEHGLVDACHGPIAHYGTVATVLSFHPAKHVAAGEGGAILTNETSWWIRFKELRDAGRHNGQMRRVGTNGRMNEMSAALARSQLHRYEQGVIRRLEWASMYDDAFAGVVETVPHHKDSARHLYQILAPERDRLKGRLAARGVGSQIHYPPIPSQPYYAKRWSDFPFPGASYHARHTLSLPLYPSMTEAQVEHVIHAVRESL